ncbi:MAG: PQQ-dependent sugar dehydrogenase [Patescibacteria group bacterium]
MKIAEDTIKDWWVFPGFELEKVATGLELPVNIAFVPGPGQNAQDPFLYVSQLYGQVKVITRDFTVHTYASDLLNFKPDYKFPGSGESGLIGIVVEPESGDLFLSMIYEDNGETKAKIIRTSSEDGLRMKSQVTVIDNIPSVHAAHQIQALSIGFDEKLYVNLGDGMIDSKVAQDDNDLRGKILRMNFDGSVPSDNPNPESLIYAKGFRNPFGATWRKSDQALYVSDNGPASNDRIAKVEPGKNYGWPESLRQNSLFWWNFTQAPTAIAFMQDSQFPEDYYDELFISLFGTPNAKGKVIKGKKIVKIKINEDNSGIVSYDEFVKYTGVGPNSPCGLAFGKDGLYFTDLFSGSLYKIKLKKEGN